MLQVKDLIVCFGPAVILEKINLYVGEGEVVGVLGPNGAGKTTLLSAISGILKYTHSKIVRLSGEIRFRDEQIDNLTAEEIARRGLILCPGKRPFREMTVIENLRVGGFLCRSKEEFKRNLETVFNLFPILKSRAKQVAGTLSGGEQQMLTIAMALMAKPKLLCIDEPSAGLAPLVRKTVFEKLKQLSKQEGVSILLAEQDARLALSISDRSYVLSSGKIVAEGTREELLKNDVVRSSYLGL
ncbi:MAG: ABC transporter ATP-binding protein [Candidatus Nezhaarchaeales archaeon]|nr:ABC transporter ATP-binding protein [Thermoproteota archaeon]TDA34008.1 MAG: branched-chain amino acid ABC transporter ATP-binding protein [Candidatus Nezhaarchaeota archaeon WYZ-LMO8]